MKEQTSMLTVCVHVLCDEPAVPYRMFCKPCHDWYLFIVKQKSDQLDTSLPCSCGVEIKDADRGGETKEVAD